MIRLVCSIVFVVALALPAGADPLKDTVPSVSVVGEAFEDVAPDRAILRFGVVTEKPAAADAAAENARVAATVLAELKSAGIADADAQTQGVTLTPYTVEERDPKGKLKGVQTMYRARNDLAVRAPIDKAGEIAGRLIDKGANNFDGIDFEFAHPEEKLAALRTAAVKDAQRRAQAYADGVGLRLARVLDIRPADDEPQPRPYAARMDAVREAAAPVPLRPGTQRLSARVAVSWALSR